MPTSKRRGGKTPITPNPQALAKAQGEHQNQLPVPYEGKPMNQTQLKNLQQLIDIDFSELKQKVQLDINMRASQRKERIEQQHSGTDKGLERMKAKVTAFEERCESAAAVLSAELQREGLTFSGGGTSAYVEKHQADQLVRPGRTEALARVGRARQRLLEVAQATISTEKRKIDRVVLLQGITGQAAQTILDDMPEVGDVFALVQAQMAEHEDDVIELLGDSE